MVLSFAAATYPLGDASSACAHAMMHTVCARGTIGNAAAANDVTQKSLLQQFGVQVHTSACLLAPACVVPPDHHQSCCCNMTSGHKQAPICSYKLKPDRKFLLFFSFALCRWRNLLKNFSVRTLLYVEQDHRRLPVVCDFQQGGEPSRKHPFVSCLVYHLADSAPQQSPCLASHPGALCTSITFTQPDTILPV